MIRGIFIAGVVAIAAPRLAWTQCVIEGPSTLCGSAAVELCAPSTPPGAIFEWWGDHELSSDQSCVTITQPGTYWLTWYDPSRGWWYGPCSKTVTAGAGAPAASITGPAVACNSAVLCGPEGDFAYWWTGPEGFSSGGRCVEVSMSGDYQLVLTPSAGGCSSAPATHSVVVGSTPNSVINGPSSGCDNVPAELCGPEGDYGFAWTGPAGFTAATRCVSVMTSGDYQLVVTGSGGCSSAPATHRLTLAACPTNPPLPDNCPRPPSWWARQCNTRSHGLAVSSSAMQSIASCVDQASAALSFSAYTTFDRTLASRFSIRARAKRHLAAVHANVCAGEMGLEMLRGPAVRLSRSTQVSLPGVSTTVGEWLDAVNQQMVALESRSLSDRAVRRQYAEIVRVGWMIDHGRGMGTVCSNDGAKVLAEDSSPAIEMAEDVASLEMQVFPTSAGSADVEFAVGSENTETVTIAVYDIAGRRVAELARGAYAPGIYRVSWQGTGSGMFFIRGRVGDQGFSESKVAIVR
jgi:hypothetical protein